ncbi:MAG: hypothetical protein JEZ10_00280 [Verrucomicrobia bacterium]|nr:hypothetical protein [Verrucomicrobiota bacterium]
MLTGWDYSVIGIYLVFMMGIGLLWSRINKNSSDYFRGGGNILWWINGMSSLAVGLTAYSFTAAGAKVFETGFLLVLVYLGGVIPYLLIYFFLAARYRQMRAVTVCDAIRRRFGKPTEQFWVWTALPIGLFQGGVMLYIISLFVSAAVGFPIIPTIIVLAIAVTVLASSGGSYAVSASDFIQMLIIIVVSVTILVRTLLLPEVGGLSGFVGQLPEHYTNFNLFERPAVWISLMMMFTTVNVMRAMDLNTNGAKFLTVKDGHHAKKACMMMIIGTAVVPLIAFTPIMAAGMMNFDLPAMFPNLQNAGEGAYIAIAKQVLPQGMMGLMVCSIFAATLSSMDTALNKNAGFFVKNFYGDIINPNASEKTLLNLGRLFSVIFGVIVMSAAILISMFRGADLFSMLLKFNVLLQFPLIIPMVLGILYKRTPGWSCWSTVVVSMGAAWLTQKILVIDSLAARLGMQMPLNALEGKDMAFIVSGLITILAGTAWYFFTALFYKQFATKEYTASVESFYKDMNTPIDHVAEDTVNQDATQYRNMSLMCFVYGGAITLGTLIPNTLGERMLFVYCGGTFLAIGGLLRFIYHRKTS